MNFKFINGIPANPMVEKCYFGLNSSNSSNRALALVLEIFKGRLKLQSVQNPPAYFKLGQRIEHVRLLF